MVAVVNMPACSAAQFLEVDLAISTSGIADPGDATPTKLVGLVYASLAWKEGVRSQRDICGDTPAEVQIRPGNMALNLARLHLLRRWTNQSREIAFLALGRPKTPVIPYEPRKSRRMGLTHPCDQTTPRMRK